MDPRVSRGASSPRHGPGGGTSAGAGASCTSSSYYPATELPPSTTPQNTKNIGTPSTENEPTPTNDPTTYKQCVLGGVHHSESEEDILIYGKPVHVHGSLSKHQRTHAPVHHDPHGNINYAKTAKEEMHEEHEHPIGTGVRAVLLPGAKTGVDMWDKVEEELPSRHRSHH